jgi:hypothetical protein
MLHVVREVRRESKRFFQSFKEWKDVMLIFIPCRLFILHQYSCAFGLNHLLPCDVMFFFFMIFGCIFSPIFDFVI